MTTFPPSQPDLKEVLGDAQWSPSRSAALYGIDRWGPPYFAVNSSGNITVRPYGDATLPGQEIDLLEVVKKVSDHPKSNGGFGLQLPLVVRFPDVLKHRVESLHAAFNVAIQEHGYKSCYQGVYPVKCHHDRFVVEDIVQFGYPFRFGLEAGSKAELLLAMSCLCKGNPDVLLICNGFKDAEFISLSLIARRLSLNTIIVLEQEAELDLVIDFSRRLAIKPVIGVRAKLKTRHPGHYEATSGEKGKFGLTTTEILQVVKKLGDVGMIDCLQLLHFHFGSQIPSVALLSDGVAEGAQIYCELVRLGANMEVIDIGGGLGIDYEGSKSTKSLYSVGYTLQEYASSVVGVIKSVCDSKSVKNPVICSESGRALVSHHSVLLFDTFSTSTPRSLPASSNLDYLFDGLPKEARLNYQNLSASAIRGDKDACLVHSSELKKLCIDNFRKGSVGMEELAAIDGICELVFRTLGVGDQVRSYHVNLSIFVSLLSYWGIGQLFPIIPIHRLDQMPGVQGILSDLTCDGDGKIDKFIGGNSSLPLHEPDGDRYYLGLFLAGAYEEELGGHYNFFGGPSVVRVSHRNGPHNFVVTRALPGHSCGDILRAMQYEPELMLRDLLHRAEEGLHHNEEHKTSVDEVANALADSFSNMPYLVSRSTR